jgi:carbon monoxide dehydrogenase subunit G
VRIEGSYVFDAPQDLVWEMSLDPDVLAHVMAGCEKLEQIGDDEYQGTMKVKVGPVQGVFQGKVKLSDLDAPTSYSVRITGRGPAGIIDGAGDVRLEASGNQTIMHYVGDAKISGRLASVGQRVMESSIRAITGQSLEDLDKQIHHRLAHDSAPSRPETPPEAAAGNFEDKAPAPKPGSVPPKDTVTRDARVAEGPPTDQATYALRIAKELLDEFVPPNQQKWLAAATGMLLLYVLVNGWTNLIARRVAENLRKGADSKGIQS